MSGSTPPSSTPPPVTNPPPTPPNTPFVKKEFDQFKNKTTVTHISKLKYETVGKRSPSETRFDFHLRQVKTKDFESLLLDCPITKISDEMFGGGYEAEKGSIIFNFDQENIELKYHESRTDSEMKSKITDNSTYEIYYQYEYGYYELKPIQFKQICDAKVLRIRISGKVQWSEPNEKWCAEFQKYCRQFYNNVFDSSLYPEAVAGGPPKSGCFVATAAMGSYDDPAVHVLTQFRDSILLSSLLGRQVVRCYYAVSPEVASWMSGKNLVRRLAKWLLVLPASMLVRLMLKQNRCDERK